MTDMPPPPEPFDPNAVPNQQYPVPGAAPTDATEKNSLAVWALVLAILTACCNLFAAVPAIILAMKSRTAVSEGRANNGGLATAALIIAIVLVIINLVYTIYQFSTGAYSDLF